MRLEDKKRLYARQGLTVDPLGSVCFYHDHAIQKDEKQRVMQVVFARDELTGKPLNDLTLTNNVNLDPRIRDFIKLNMQEPVAPERGVADYSMAEELCRRPHESTMQYSHRLSKMALDSEQYIKSAATTVRKSKKLK